MINEEGFERAISHRESAAVERAFRRCLSQTDRTRWRQIIRAFAKSATPAARQLLLQRLKGLQLRRQLEPLEKDTRAIQVVGLSDSVLRQLQLDPQRLSALTPEQFEHFVAERLERMGYNVQSTGNICSKDGGVDLIATSNQPTAASWIMACQVKHHCDQRPTGRPAADRLLAWQREPFHFGMLVTNTRFTVDARWLANQHPMFLRLRDFEDLKRWLRDSFDDDAEVREMPTEIELAPGIVVPIPGPRLRSRFDMPELW